jgi:hypothetical protein
MESIAELRKICQTTAKKDRSNWYMRHVSRFFSIYLTRLLLPTPTTPNQVSFAMIVTGVASCILFLCPGRGMFFVAALVLQFWYVLDCSDGEVARYRQYQKKAEIITDKRNSPMAGSYYDMMNHYIINFLVPMMLGYGLFFMTNQLIYLNLGVVGSLGQVLMLAMHDGRSRALLAQIRKFDSIKVVKTEAPEGEKKKRSLPHVLFMGLHYSMTYPTVMNLVLVASVLNFIVPIFDWRIPLLVYLALGSAVVTSVFIARTIDKRTIEEEFKNGFEVPHEN